MKNCKQNIKCNEHPAVEYRYHSSNGTDGWWYCPKCKWNKDRYAKNK